MAKSKGLAGMSYEKIMMQQAVSKAVDPTYCRYCGKDVKVPSNNSPAGNNGRWQDHLEWEIHNEAHRSCHQRHVAGQRR